MKKKHFFVKTKKIEPRFPQIIKHLILWRPLTRVVFALKNTMEPLLARRFPVAIVIITLV